MLPRVKGGGKRPLTRLAMAVAAMGLFLVGYYWGNQYRPGGSTLPVIEGVWVHPPHSLLDFEIRDAAGRPFTAQHLAGRWTLLAFGNQEPENGRHVLARMIEIHNRLAGNPDLQERLLLALVTRSREPTPTADSDYSSPVLRLLSGEADELQRLRAALGISTQEATVTTGQAIPCYLIGPASWLLALFSGAQTPASIASDLVAIAAHAVSSDPADN